jgi:sulfur dioxygenase
MLFTGDVLLVRKTGRTDFQGGSAEKLYHSIMEKFYTLPDSTLIYPGHDYTGQMMSTIGEEKMYNVRIRENTSLDEFVETMKSVQLEYPKYIDEALPANMKL